MSRLNAWWLQLGIVHQRITPASPQENGAHERLHRVLKAKVTKPAAAHAKLQQRVCNTFVQTYPGHFEIRRVSTAGTFRLHNGQQFLTHVLNREMVGLEEVQDGLWNVL